MFGDFFYMPKSDRKIILSAVLLIGVAVGIIIFVGGGKTAAPATIGQADTAVLAMPAETYEAPMADVSAERFTFDPNTADSASLKRLGLTSWQIRNLYKYREMGGAFSRKEDFARLYGLTVKQYRELEPYIVIGADYRPAVTLFADRRTEHRDTTFTPRYPVKLAEGETIDLATADTTLLQRVPGIGPYFARRIVDYRRRLGGYISLSQLVEIVDFPQEALSFFTLEEGVVPVEKLQVNSLSLNELKRHPYLNFYQARAIVDYRRQNGPIADISELRLLSDFSDADIDRLRPYVSY